VFSFSPFRLSVLARVKKGIGCVRFLFFFLCFCLCLVVAMIREKQNEKEQKTRADKPHRFLSCFPKKNREWQCKKKQKKTVRHLPPHK
jgi:hypothetical protein